MRVSKYLEELHLHYFLHRIFFPRELDLLTSRKQVHWLTRACNLSCTTWNEIKTREIVITQSKGRARIALMCRWHQEPEAPQHSQDLHTHSIYSPSQMCAKSSWRTENFSHGKSNWGNTLPVQENNASCTPRVQFFPPVKQRPWALQHHLNNTCRWKIRTPVIYTKEVCSYKHSLSSISFDLWYLLIKYISKHSCPYVPIPSPPQYLVPGNFVLRSRRSQESFHSSLNIGRVTSKLCFWIKLT